VKGGKKRRMKGEMDVKVWTGQNSRSEQQMDKKGKINVPVGNKKKIYSKVLGCSSRKLGQYCMSEVRGPYLVK